RRAPAPPTTHCSPSRTTMIGVCCPTSDSDESSRRSRRCASAAPRNADPTGAAQAPLLAATLRTERRLADGVSPVPDPMSATFPCVFRRLRPHFVSPPTLRQLSPL